jgi:hypothetical protein
MDELCEWFGGGGVSALGSMCVRREAGAGRLTGETTNRPGGNCLSGGVNRLTELWH